MSKTTYNISLKGYVGGYDFDRSTVDRELAKNEGKQVNVLIDSLGGSLATGLSISAAFRNHGNVNVHFVGLNASASLQYPRIIWVKTRHITTGVLCIGAGPRWSYENSVLRQNCLLLRLTVMNEAWR